MLTVLTALLTGLLLAPRCDLPLLRRALSDLDWTGPEPLPEVTVLVPDRVGSLECRAGERFDACRRRALLGSPPDTRAVIDRARRRVHASATVDGKEVRFFRPSDGDVAD